MNGQITDVDQGVLEKTGNWQDLKMKLCLYYEKVFVNITKPHQQFETLRAYETGFELVHKNTDIRRSKLCTNSSTGHLMINTSINSTIFKKIFCSVFTLVLSKTSQELSNLFHAVCSYTDP